MATAAQALTLKREMSGFGGMVITLTNLSPSIGVFLAAPVVIQQSGSFVVIALILAVLLGLVVAGLYAELGSAIPHAGGDYVLIGATLGPTLRFATLAGALVGLPVALALSGLGIAEFLKVTWANVPAIPVAMACIIAATLLGAMSVRANALITGSFLILEITALIATAWLGVLHPHQDLLQVAIHPVVAAAGGGLRPVKPLEMAIGGAAAIYALNGYGAAVFFGEEVIGARRKMIWMIYGALAMGGLTIVVPVIGVIQGTHSLAALSSSATPLQDFILEAGGRQLAGVIGLAVAISIFNAMIAIVLVGGRVLYSAARENALGSSFSGPLAQVHPRYGSPWVATIVIGLVGVLLCFVPLAVLVLINGNGAALNYATLAFAVMVGRRTGATAGSKAPMPLFPAGPILVVITVMVLVIAGLLDEGSGRAGIIVSLGTMALGALYYQVLVRRSLIWAHHDPAEEAEAI